MAESTTPVPGRITLWQGRVFLRLARLIQRTLAHRRSRVDVALRNRAMRAAHARGIDREALKGATGLSAKQVGDVLKDEPTTE